MPRHQEKDAVTISGGPEEAAQQPQNPPTEFEIQFRADCWFKIYVSASSEEEAERKFDEWYRGNTPGRGVNIWGDILDAYEVRPDVFNGIHVEVLPKPKDPTELRGPVGAMETKWSWVTRRGWETEHADDSDVDLNTTHK